MILDHVEGIVIVRGVCHIVTLDESHGVAECQLVNIDSGFECEIEETFLGRVLRHSGSQAICDGTSTVIRRKEGGEESAVSLDISDVAENSLRSN